MKTTKAKEENLSILLAVLLGILGLWVFMLVQPSFSQGDIFVVNSTSLNINTTVNITNSAPIITAITLDTPIDLTAYNTTQVFCNVTTFDFDNETLTVNATLYLLGTSQPNDTDDGNNHYTNSTCLNQTAQDNYMNWTCAFNVQYYADNSSAWYCNVTVDDQGAVLPSNVSNNSTINPLVAIRMYDVIDYGNLAVGQTSNDTEANITNAGNRDANITVRGYGATVGDGDAFNCTYGTIDLSYERYNVTNNSSFTDMTQLTGSDVLIPSFNVPQRTSQTDDSMNKTYWKVQIPIGAGGVCNGHIVFTASDRVG